MARLEVAGKGMHRGGKEARHRGYRQMGQLVN
jgi:hypothetical protein